MSNNKTNSPVHGIVLVNKPPGLTSNTLLQKVKRLYGAKKAGHTGSLDPLATGMLPICLGEATKFCQYLLDADKCYEATGLLGIKTNTADAMGEIIQQTAVVDISLMQLQQAIQRFTGVIQQVPSMFSALKQQGVPLYKLARKGQEVARSARTVTIHKLELIALHTNHEFAIKVHCSKGTYIRNLVEDIGDYLAVGAHVIKLHRVYTAGFADEKMYDLSELEHQSFTQLLHCLLPMQRAVNHFPVINLTGAELLCLRQGKVITLKYSTPRSDCVQLLSEEGHFIGLGEVTDEQQLKVKRLLTEEAILIKACI